MPFKKVKEMMMSGKPKRQAVAMALAEMRKAKQMAAGGMVDDDLDEEHERSLGELMVQGDQPPVASPETENMEEKLAMSLHKAHEAEEYYAMGGLVEGMDGDEEPEVMHAGAEEPMSSEPSKPNALGHSKIDGVPMLEPSGLSEEAKKALEYKKKMRRFSK